MSDLVGNPGYRFSYDEAHLFEIVGDYIDCVGIRKFRTFVVRMTL